MVLTPVWQAGPDIGKALAELDAKKQAAIQEENYLGAEQLRMEIHDLQVLD